MELRHLRYFVAIGEEENYRRAAQRLHVAQTALSTQIQDLETELGFKLFDRLPRGVKLWRRRPPVPRRCAAHSSAGERSGRSRCSRGARSIGDIARGLHRERVLAGRRPGFVTELPGAAARCRVATQSFDQLAAHANQYVATLHIELLTLLGIETAVIVSVADRAPAHFLARTPRRIPAAPLKGIAETCHTITCRASRLAQ